MGQRVEVFGDNSQRSRVSAFQESEIAVSKLWHLRVGFVSILHEFLTLVESMPERL